MAKEIEIAFSLIRHNPEFRRLTPGARGAFMTLAQVCLLDGYDPLPEGTTALCRLSGAVPCGWRSIKNDVVRALGALLGPLRIQYNEDKAMRITRSAMAKHANEHRKAVIACKEELRERAHNFVAETSIDIGFIQPFRHQTFRPKSHDAKLRATAVKVAANSKAAPLKD